MGAMAALNPPLRPNDARDEQLGSAVGAVVVFSHAGNMTRLRDYSMTRVTAELRTHPEWNEKALARKRLMLSKRHSRL